MKLSEYKFPEPSMVLNTTPELLEEAKKRNPKEGIQKFSELFFNGGEIELQEDVKGSWKEKAYLYAKALMSSWEPKHEHKELVVGMIFEETLVLKKNNLLKKIKKIL